jgi:hypothetical protein
MNITPSRHDVEGGPDKGPEGGPNCLANITPSRHDVEGGRDKGSEGGGLDEGPPSGHDIEGGPDRGPEGGPNCLMNRRVRGGHVEREGGPDGGLDRTAKIRYKGSEGGWDCDSGPVARGMKDVLGGLERE